MKISILPLPLLLLAPAIAAAQTTTVTVTGLSPTQAILYVTARNSDGSPFAGNCTYRVSEGDSFVTSVNDLNAVLFPGANSDSRPGAIVNGKDHYFVAGTRMAAKASDSKFYSRALQAATHHWAGVTCSTAPEKSVLFTTPVPPLGDAYPEFPAFDNSAFGNRATPTIDFLDQSKAYIDPLSGVLIKRVTSPADYTTGNYQHKAFNFVRDVAGNGWTNPQNALTVQKPATLASSSTPNKSLFLSWNGLEVASVFDLNDTVNDLMLRAYCTGQNGGTLQACISIDSGNTCATDTVDLACPAAVGEVDAPASYPSPMFTGWGIQHQTLSKQAMGNQPNVMVRVAGSTVSWIAGAIPFNTDRAAGTKILIAGTAPNCINNLCTIKSVDTNLQITIQESLTVDLGGSTLTTAAAAGATSVAVNGAGNLYAGNHVQFETGTSNQESAQVAATYVIGSKTIPLQAPLTKTHALATSAYWAGLDDGGLAGPNLPGHLAAIGTFAGATTITLIDTAVGLAPGEPIIIDLRNPTQETVNVALNYQIGSLTVPLQTPLQFNHSGQGWTPYVGWSNGVTLQDYGAGVMVWLKSTAGSPSVSASFTFDDQTSKQFFGASNADFDTCSTKMITDIATDRAGNPISPPLSGYLCSFSGQDLVLWIPSTGEARLISAYYQQNVGYMSVPASPFSIIDPKTLFATNIGNSHLYKAVLNNPAGVYLPYKPGPSVPPAQDQLVWTDITAQTTPMTQQLASFGGPAAAAYATGLFPTLTFVGLIGGYTVYDTSTGSDGPCIKVRGIADTNQLLQAFDSWDFAPLRWGGCHSAPIGFGSYLNLTLNAIQGFNKTLNLEGPFELKVSQLKRGGSWQAFTQNITAATNSNPVTLTAAGHGLDPYFSANYGSGPTKGPQIVISGATGNWAPINGTWFAGASTSNTNTFTIPLDTTSLGPLTGALTFSATPPLIHSKASSITSTTPAVVTTFNQLGNEPLNHRFQDGDPIAFGNLSNTQQYYAKVTGYSNSTFAVFSDQSLTQPVSGATLTAASGGLVYFAETCPTGLPASVTSSMKFDSMGATGVRCFTFRVAGEPCSYFATAAEFAKLPCKADPTNSGKSSLTDMQVGDAIRDVARGPYDETFVLVQKVKNSETDIQATFMRWYGNTVSGDTHTFNPSANSHDVGWTPIMVPTNSHAAATGWIDALDPTNTFLSADPNFSAAHADFGYGSGPGLVTFAGGLPDHIVNKTMKDLLNTTLTYTKKEAPAWANSPQTQLTYNVIETYPGHRQFSAAPAEMVWKGDWKAVNPGFGSAQGSGSGLINGMIITTIRGTPYDPGSTTNNVYKVTNVAGPFDRKRTPTYSWAGKWMLRDKSGPGSVITDTDLWNYCVADNPGECRATSAKNDTFIVGTGFAYTNGYCMTNTFTLTSPCFTGANPSGGWAMQIQIDPIDTTGYRLRRLTMGLAAPGMHFSFQTWLQSPDGKWGFFSTPYINGTRNDYFAMKLPPWPGAAYGQAEDPSKRSDFIRYVVTLQPAPGAAYARARFGYAESGPVASLFCTSRQESCSSEIPVSSPTDLFAYAGETATHLPCTSQCKVTIPAVPGRVLYYVIDRLDASGAVLSTSPLTAVAIP